MATASIGPISCEVDPEATREIYRQISSGGTTACGCEHCLNFASQVPQLFPSEVLDFFAAAGIDPHKDAEVYEMGESGPGRRFYGGEYYFISGSRPAADTAALPGGFTFAFTEPSPLVPDAFRGVAGSTCFYFTCSVPWVSGGGT